MKATELNAGEFWQVLGLIAIGVAIYLLARRFFRQRESPEETRIKTDMEQYGFPYTAVSMGLDQASEIRNHMDRLAELDLKIDMESHGTYNADGVEFGIHDVLEIRWFDWKTNAYVAYDLPIHGNGCEGNAAIMHQLVAAERNRLTTSLFREIHEIQKYGEVKTVDKTGRGVGEGSDEDDE